MLTVDEPQPVLRRQPHPARPVASRCRAGKVTALLGRNGVGKTTLLRTLMGLVPATSGEVVFDGRDLTHAQPYERARAGHRLRAAGPRDLPAPHGRGEPARWASPRGRAARACPARIFEMFPVLQQMLRPARRRPLRRPAAAARHRPRARHGAEAADPRRAHRRHPALDHQGHRARDPHARRERRDGDPAGRAVLRLRALARRPVPGDGARRDRRARRRRRHGPRRACAACWRYDRAHAARRAACRAAPGRPSSRSAFERRGERTVLARRAPRRPARRAEAALSRRRRGLPRDRRASAGGHRRRRRARPRRATRGAGAHALLTTPGAGKWYRSAGAVGAAARSRFDVGRRALEWLPQETIVFDGALRRHRHASRPRRRRARYIGWEIVCLGRTGSGERFDQRRDARCDTEIARDGTAAVASSAARIDGGGALLRLARGARRQAGLRHASSPRARSLDARSSPPAASEAPRTAKAR